MNKIKLITALALAGASVSVYSAGPEDLKGAQVPEVAAPEPVAEQPAPPPPAPAAPAPAVYKWYAGAMLGKAVYKDACDDDDDDTAWSAFIGYAFNENFALEGGYVDLGAIDSLVGDCERQQDIVADPSADGISLAAVVRAPIGQKFSIYGKGGAFAWNMDRDAAGGLPAASDDGISPLLGVGLGYSFTERFEGRLEYDRFFDVGEQETTGQTDIDALMIGGAFKF